MGGICCQRAIYAGVQLQAGNLPPYVPGAAVSSAQREQLANFWREQMAEIQQVSLCRSCPSVLIGACPLKGPLPDWERPERRVKPCGACAGWEL